MKALLMAALVLFSSSVFSAETLTVDRQNVKAAEIRALANGKKVLYRVTGGWCSLCLLLDNVLEAHRDELAPSLAKYEWVDYNDSWQELPRILDGVPFIHQYFPMFFVIDPVTGKMNYISPRFMYDQRIDYFIAALDQFAATGDLTSWSVDRYRAALADGKSLGTAGDASHYEELDGAAMNLGITGSASELAGFMNDLRAAAEAHPAQFEFRDDRGLVLDSVVNLAYVKYAERGGSLPELRLYDPTALTKFEEYFVAPDDVTFYAPINVALHQVGYAAASRVCFDKLGVFKDDPYMHATGETLCHALAYLGGTETSADVRTFIATQSDDFKAKGVRWLAVLAATSENFDLAAEYEKAAYQKWLLTEDRPALLARIKKNSELRLEAFTIGKSRPAGNYPY